MKLTSFEDLCCLLSEEEQDKIRKEREYQSFIEQNCPYNLRTERRLLPLLPRWMRSKLIEATELYDTCNTSMNHFLLWNHVITLPLDDRHDVTFAILDDTSNLSHLEKEVAKIVETYKSLQTLYNRYRHPLTVVSLQTDDFGMYLPDWFYDPDEGPETPERTYPHEDEHNFPDEDSLRDTLDQLIAPHYSRMTLAMQVLEKAEKTLDPQELIRMKTWFTYQHKKLMDCRNAVKTVLGRCQNDYLVQPMLECLDIYMSRRRGWTREFCVKWNLDDDVKYLKKLDNLRPLIDDIIKATKHEQFAFGIKQQDATVVPCDYVTAR